MKNVANEILNQLGGNKFISMTGAKNFVTDGANLTFQLPKNKSGANRLTITLKSNDTYQLNFWKLGRNFVIINIETLEDIYAEQLQETFTNKTGLLTSLAG